ncbi:TVP38/TMEM64 family protein [Mycobacterium sp. ACS4331]|uniref:TVP38/TMEM64 family protein n=1 Tax=Mycobacterium sp. ACS4331 TaxID=1834121 RepID=UPI0009EF4019|nr:TVP38/TMEM64 family protein [Mycobacterium sp. ACS4331]
MPAAVRSTVRQIPRRRIVLTAFVIVILVAVALLVPVPTAIQLRDWARSLGPWFPLAFLALHSVVTVLPFPRTAFTLAAGLLFGAALGITLAVVASAISALIALVAVRAFGWQMSSLVSHPSIDSIDAHLRRRGWLAVMSLRLIPAVPFSVINYAAGASAVRPLPYLCATVIGLAPGTSAVVILGDALTGSISPTLVLVSACTASVGIAGIIYEIRDHRRARGAARPASAEAPAQPDGDPYKPGPVMSRASRNDRAAS